MAKSQHINIQIAYCALSTFLKISKMKYETTETFKHHEWNSGERLATFNTSKCRFGTARSQRFWKSEIWQSENADTKNSKLVFCGWCGPRKTSIGDSEAPIIQKWTLHCPVWWPQVVASLSSDSVRSVSFKKPACRRLSSKFSLALVLRHFQLKNQIS